MSPGVGSTGVPTDRSTMPSGGRRARCPAGASRSHGKSGNLSLIMGLSCETPVCHQRNPMINSWSVSRLVGVDVGGQSGHQGVVLVDLADLGGTTGRAEIVEELDVGLVVVLPLVRGVVLVEDRLDRADRLARTAVDALVGVDVEHPGALVDAVDRALLDAGAVENIDTRLGDDVGHAETLLGRICPRLVSRTAASAPTPGSPVARQRVRPC